MSEKTALADCQTCDGSGFYTPKFSPDALVNCRACNADLSKGGVEWDDDEGERAVTGRDNFRRPEEYTVADWPERPADRHPETQVWVARIEAVRRGTPSPTTRRCLGTCGRVLPLTTFTRNRALKGGGRRYVCPDCEAVRLRALRQRRKLAIVREILGVAS